VGLGAGAVIKSFVDVGKEVESLQVRFKFLFGSVEEGSLAFNKEYSWSMVFVDVAETLGELGNVPHGNG
ncbi:MAG: hypothetical protein ACPHGY_09620, partial [Rhodospirillaceae bacterium]